MSSENQTGKEYGFLKYDSKVWEAADDPQQRLGTVII